jgi:hypothetical protein
MITIHEKKEKNTLRRIDEVHASRDVKRMYENHKFDKIVNRINSIFDININCRVKFLVSILNFNKKV